RNRVLPGVSGHQACSGVCGQLLGGARSGMSRFTSLLMTKTRRSHMRGVRSFGLVALAGLLAVPAAVCADEAAVIAWVQKNRGRIVRDDKQPDRPVVSVDLYQIGRTDVDDADLKRLFVFPKLRSLNVGFSLVTDAGLKLVSAFPELEHLNLCFTRVSDTG